MNHKVFTAAFIFHTLLEILGGFTFIYMALSGDMGFIENAWPAEMWEGFDIKSPGYRYPIWVIGNLIVGQGILGIVGLRSQPGTSIRKILVFLFAMFHMSVSILSHFIFPEMSGKNGFLAQLINPHFYMAVWFLVLSLLIFMGRGEKPPLKNSSLLL